MLATVSAEVPAADSDNPAPAWPRCRTWAAEVGVLVLCAIVIPLGLAVHYGSLYSPAADDWSYDLATFHLAFHGAINLNHWGTVDAIGQVVLAAPFVWLFGPHVAVLNIWTCLVGFGGLLATDYLLRRAGAPRWVALTATAALSIGPMWAAIAVSFMTDIPSFSVMMIALAVAVSDTGTARMLTRRSALALCLGAVAFSIREPTGIAFVAIAAGRLWRCPQRTRSDRLRWGGLVAAVGLASLLFYVWRRRLPTTGYETPPVVNPSLLVEWYSRQWLLPLLGLMLLVPVLVSHPLRAVRAAWRRQRGAVVSMWLALVVGPWVVRFSYYQSIASSHGHGWTSSLLTLFLAPPLGNWYFSNTGDASLLQPIVPVWGIALLGLVATLAWVALGAYVTLAWSRWRSERHAVDQQARYAALLAAVSAAGSVALLALIIVTTEQMWDRYLLPVAGAMMVVVVYGAGSAELRAEKSSSRPLRGTVGVVGALAMSAIVVSSLAYTVAMDGWDGSEWAYSTAFARTVPQVPAKDIFTNWLWNSVQAGVDTEPQYGLAPTYRPCWVEVATHSPVDWTPSAPHPKVVFRRAYSNWVVTYRYQMEPYDGASTRAVCHMGQASSP